MKRGTNKTYEDQIDRRTFLKRSGLAAVGLGNPMINWVFQSFLKSSIAGAEINETFVLVFLRGGADGLSILPPAPGNIHYENYAAMRPNLKLELGDMNLLGATNTGFGLSKACPNIFEAFNAGRVSFYLGVGNRSSTSRSHFEQQDYVDRGGTGKQNDGFLYRALSISSPLIHSVTASSIGPVLSKSLLGNQAHSTNLIVPVSSLDTELALKFQGNTYTAGLNLPERLRKTWGKATAGEKAALASLELKKAADIVKPITFEGYGKLNQFRTAAQVLVGFPNIRFLTIDVDGWDTHKDMGPKEGGYFYKLLSSLDQALHAFLEDLKKNHKRVKVVILSEFGRPLRENGSMGLDHGRGGIALTIDNYSSKPIGLSKPSIFDRNLFSLENIERDLPILIDHRELLGHVLMKSGFVSQNHLAQIFPKSDKDELKYNIT